MPIMPEKRGCQRKAHGFVPADLRLYSRILRSTCRLFCLPKNCSFFNYKAIFMLERREKVVWHVLLQKRSSAYKEKSAFLFNNSLNQLIKDQLVYKSNAQDRLCLNIRAWYHLVSLGNPINLQLRLDDPASLFFFYRKK